MKQSIKPNSKIALMYNPNANNFARVTNMSLFQCVAISMCRYF